MADPTLRGPKLPLSWSTTTITGYVVEKHDDDEKVDIVREEDENSQYCFEASGLRRMSDVTIEVLPLASLSSPPAAGDLLTYGSKAMVIKSIKKARGKGAAVKWTISGESCPLIHT